MASWIRSIIENGSYPGLVFLMVLENVFPPIPSELIVPLAGFVSTQGQIHPVGVIIAATGGSLIGALVLYALGRMIGGERLHRWAGKHGRWIGLSPGDLEKSDRWFERYGGWTVLFGRLIPGVRSLISIPAGTARMALLPFVLYTTIGSALWTTALALAGRALGEKYELVEKYVGPVSTSIVILLIAIWLFRAIRHYRRPTAAA